ncbi:hypothetical protein FOL46_003624 [Perkinsus olseni]|uniref:Uncharacterized protein n=1 Tax=Perkinsus olseni TaxID=32597 RepID=A0A7J6MTH7_PEROL|nr:hypothetical protein FOL46_003624 [Perkinsus olseni]
MSTPDSRRVKIVVSPLSVPHSAARRPSKVDDGEGRKTSLVSLPEKRVLQPSSVENIAESLSSVSKKPCVRGGSDAPLEGENVAELRAEIGRLQERIAWMASTAGPEANSGLRLADMQEELRQERENSGKLKVKMERLERRVADSDRLQAALEAAREEAGASREQVAALELRIASYEDHDRTLAALTKMNQELDQRATEAAKETEAVREAYEEKLASLEEELRDLRVSSKESDKGLRNEFEGAAAESKQLAARLEKEQRAHVEELERMEATMAEAREASEETVRGLTTDLNHLKAQCEDMDARLMEKEEEHKRSVADLQRLLRESEARFEEARVSLARAEALAEKESGMLLEMEAMKAALLEKTARLRRSEADVTALRAQLEAGPVDSAAELVDQSTATEGAEWALMVNASCNTTLPEERPLASAETQEEGKWRAEVDSLTIALKKCRGKLTAAREEGDRLAALLEEGKERAEVFMKQREGERRGMQMMVDDLEEELRRYKYSLAEREATEITALAEAILNDATGTAVTMAVAREMGKASEGLRMGLEEVRTRWCEEERLRRCVEESNRRLAAAMEETREEVVQVRRQSEDLRGALESVEQEREHIAMVKAEEAVAMNRLDEAVRRLEMERDEVEDKWAETEESMQREMEDMGEELAHWQGRAEDAEGRLAEEVQKAEEAAAAAAKRHGEELQVYEKQLRDLIEQMSTLEASASDTARGLMRELEAARLEGNDVSQCLINQRQGYERMMAEMAERVGEAEEKLAVSEATVEETRAELAAREEALAELIQEKEEAVKGLEEQLAISRGDAVREVEELQRALNEERERHSEQAQTSERHIDSLERQVEQARVGYEKHIEEMKNYLSEMESEHEVEIARIGKEAIMEHDELIESFNARIAQLQEEVDEGKAQIESLKKDSAVLMESMKEAARSEATRISEEYERKIETLSTDLASARKELAEVQEEATSRIEEARAEAEKRIFEREAEHREQLHKMEEAARTRVDEKDREAELVRGELQKTIARLFEEKEALSEVHARTEAMLERQMEEESSKASSDRAQLVVSNTALLADTKAQYQMAIDEAEERLKGAVARAEKAEQELDQQRTEAERTLGHLRSDADARVKDLSAALEEQKAKTAAIEKQAASMRAELARVKSSIGDAVRGAEKGWEVAIRNLVELPERYKATYDDFLQAKVRIEELTKELAEGHKQQNRLEERIKRLQSGKLSPSDERTESTARQLRYEIRQLKDQYADLATRNIDFKRMAAEARCEAVQSAKLIVTYKREKDAAVLEKEEALAGLGKAERKRAPLRTGDPQGPKGESSSPPPPLPPKQPARRANPPVKSALKKPSPEPAEGKKRPQAAAAPERRRAKAKQERSPPPSAVRMGDGPSVEPSEGSSSSSSFRKLTPEKAGAKRSAAAPMQKDPLPSKRRISMSPEDCKQQ